MLPWTNASHGNGFRRLVYNKSEFSRRLRSFVTCPLSYIYIYMLVGYFFCTMQNWSIAFVETLSIASSPIWASKAKRARQRLARLLFTIYPSNRELARRLKTPTPIGVRAGGARGAAAPPKFWQLRFFGQLEKIWAKPGFKDVSLFLFNVILKR